MQALSDKHDMLARQGQLFRPGFLA